MYDHTLSLLQRKVKIGLTAAEIKAAEIKASEVEKKKREANSVHNSKKEEGYAEREGVVFFN